MNSRFSFAHALVMGLCYALFAVTGASAPAAAARADTPLARHGRLHVQGLQLAGEDGQPVQLRGVSTHGLQWFGHCATPDAVQALAADWGVSVIRAASYVTAGGYADDPALARRKIREIVDLAEAAGVYVIIDWHLLQEGNPLHHLASAQAFWKEMAAEYAGRDHVIYEIANEPNGADWADIKRYAEIIIPLIRARDPEAVVLVGTPQWSSHPLAAARDPLAGELAENVMYTFHFYAASHKHYERLQVAAGRIPLFVSEFGLSEHTGGGRIDAASGDRWLEILAGDNAGEAKISWVGWSFADKAESSALLQPGSCGRGEWRAATAAGAWLRGKLLDEGAEGVASR